MRALVRNCSDVYYANRVSTDARTDKFGNKIGTTSTYETPIKISVPVSPVTGEVVVDLFGANEKYDLIVTLYDTVVDEFTRFWIDTDVGGSHDYEVSRVAKNLNLTVVALSKVKVSV